ncbi:MAG: hypothetical protein R3E10_02655 [Gemmatimonadota bacterium]
MGDKPETAGVPSQSPVERVSDRLDADLFVASCPMSRATAERLIGVWADAQHRPNCGLILTTDGGDAAAAYLIARFLKRAYERFTLYVFGRCKSAGTLVALGADEIVMSAHGELGPLDVQMVKDDELARFGSGADYSQAVSYMLTSAFAAWENNFLAIVNRSVGQISTRTAADIATQFVSNLFQPMMAQLDPLKLSEAYRANSIGLEYGTRLGASAETVDRLVSDYPDHGFVIDIEEAQELFRCVRTPEVDELELEEYVRRGLSKRLGSEHLRVPGEKPVLACLTPASQPPEETSDGSSSGEEQETQGLDVPSVREGGNGRDQAELSSVQEGLPGDHAYRGDGEGVDLGPLQ